jgi:hypothetical protein
MKKILLSLSLVTVALAGKAQCSDLFFSKYLSNGSNNKALELYNPTPNPIVLNGTYYIARYKTGTAGTAIPMTYSDTIWLKGTIPSYSTFLVANPEVTPSTSNNNAVCDPRIHAKAVQPNGMWGNLYGTYGSTTGDPTYFKGSDVLTIEKKVGTIVTIVDLFGKRGDVLVNAAGTSTTAWSTIAPYTGGTGMGKWITKGYLMVRKQTVQTGVTTDPSGGFDPLAQWDTIAKPHTAADTTALYNLLGSHTCNCKPVGIHELTNNIVSSVFPNPTGDNSKVTISSSEFIKSYVVFSVTGSVVKQEELVQPKNNLNLTVDQLIKGVYFVQMKHTSGLTSITRFIKN